MTNRKKLLVTMTMLLVAEVEVLALAGLEASLGVSLGVNLEVQLEVEAGVEVRVTLFKIVLIQRRGPELNREAEVLVEAGVVVELKVRKDLGLDQGPDQDLEALKRMKCYEIKTTKRRKKMIRNLKSMKICLLIFRQYKVVGRWKSSSASTELKKGLMV